MKLSYGQWIMTRGINNEVADDANFAEEIMRAVKRYVKGDWGELCEEDNQVNKEALEIGERIFARYDTSKGIVYIITERDRSCTTILFANEY